MPKSGKKALSKIAETLRGDVKGCREGSRYQYQVEENLERNLR